MITLLKKKNKNHFIFILIILPVEIYLQCEVLVKTLANRVKCFLLTRAESCNLLGITFCSYTVLENY